MIGPKLERFLRYTTALGSVGIMALFLWGAWSIATNDLSQRATVAQLEETRWVGVLLLGLAAYAWAVIAWRDIKRTHE